MKLALLATLTLVLSGCAMLHEHALGTKVNTFTIKDKEYVHCSILMDRTRPEMIESSLKVCRDGVTK